MEFIYGRLPWQRFPPPFEVWSARVFQAVVSVRLVGCTVIGRFVYDFENSFPKNSYMLSNYFIMMTICENSLYYPPLLPTLPNSFFFHFFSIVILVTIRARRSSFFFFQWTLYSRTHLTTMDIFFYSFVLCILCTNTTTQNLLKWSLKVLYTLPEAHLTNWLTDWPLDQIIHIVVFRPRKACSRWKKKDHDSEIHDIRCASRYLFIDPKIQRLARCLGPGNFKLLVWPGKLYILGSKFVTINDNGSNSFLCGPSCVVRFSAMPVSVLVAGTLGRKLLCSNYKFVLILSDTTSTSGSGIDKYLRYPPCRRY